MAQSGKLTPLHVCKPDQRSIHSGRKTVALRSVTISESLTDCPVVRFNSLRIAVTTLSEVRTFAKDLGEVAHAIWIMILKHYRSGFRVKRTASTT